MRQPRYSFTQPVCGDCYEARYPGREPTRVIDAEIENCCDCTTATRSGVYIRVDPATVTLPTLTKDD